MTFQLVRIQPLWLTPLPALNQLPALQHLAISVPPLQFEKDYITQCQQEIDEERDLEKRTSEAKEKERVEKFKQQERARVEAMIKEQNRVAALEVSRASSATSLQVQTPPPVVKPAPVFPPKANTPPPKPLPVIIAKTSLPPAVSKLIDVGFSQAAALAASEVHGRDEDKLFAFATAFQTLAEEGHSERIIKDALVSHQGNLQQARQALANARLVSLGSSVSEDDAYTILGLVAGDVELANKYAVASNQLCTIGFTRAETLNALLSTGGDQNLALDCLLNQADRKSVV